MTEMTHAQGGHTLRIFIGLPLFFAIPQCSIKKEAPKPNQKLRRRANGSLPLYKRIS